MAVITANLASIQRRRALAAEPIHTSRYRFQVSRSSAMSHAAEMVEFQPFGDRAGEHFVHQPVNRVVLALQGELTVAVPVYKSGPEQAA